jgi:hypothetical protein
LRKNEVINLLNLIKGRNVKTAAFFYFLKIAAKKFCGLFFMCVMYLKGALYGGFIGVFFRGADLGNHAVGYSVE